MNRKNCPYLGIEHNKEETACIDWGKVNNEFTNNPEGFCVTLKRLIRYRCHAVFQNGFPEITEEVIDTCRGRNENSYEDCKVFKQREMDA